MDTITNYLQKQPVIILSMFLISVLSGVISIVLGWEKFYRDFLSKQLEVPIWFLLLFGLIILLIYVFRPSSKNPKKPIKELETVEGKKFGVQQIEIDGKKFVNCDFDGTELIFKGENGFSLEHNSFDSPPRIKFIENAGTTLAVLQAFHKSPEFRNYISQLFPNEI